MKKLLYLSSVALLTYACTSDSGEELEPDCSLSGLSISVENKVDPSCTAPGSFTLVATGGDGNYEYSMDNINFTAATTYEDQAAGNYTATVRDGNDCIATVRFSLSGDEALTLEIQSSGCDDGEGEITAVASGGDGNFQYQLDNGNFGTESTFSGLQFGTYTVTVTDGSGCTASQSEIKIGVSLTDDIFPIIEANCALSGCHLNVQDPLYQSKSDVIAAADKIKTRTSAGTMPPSGPLPPDQVKLIADWVDCGAPDN